MNTSPFTARTASAELDPAHATLLTQEYHLYRETQRVCEWSMGKDLALHRLLWRQLGAGNDRLGRLAWQIGLLGHDAFVANGDRLPDPIYAVADLSALHETLAVRIRMILERASPVLAETPSLAIFRNLLLEHEGEAEALRRHAAKTIPRAI